eukprot:2328366-Pleurochrysis_carterae.AAC.1
MDGNKNCCPSFTRDPKGTADELKEALKLHVLGLIIHGKTDNVNLFPAAPHLNTGYDKNGVDMGFGVRQVSLLYNNSNSA